MATSTARKTTGSEAVGPFVMEFTRERETPGTVRYSENVPDDDVAKIRTIYFQKFFAARDMKNAPRCRITIEPLFDEE